MWYFVKNFKSNFTETISDNTKRMKDRDEERKKQQRSLPESDAAK
jgi:hypothetical protein